MNYISHVYQNNILRINFKGEIDSSNVYKIKERITKLRRNYKPNKIIFNFEEVGFIDSAGIGLILGRYNEYRLDHITLVLVGVNKYIDHFGDDGNGQRLTAEFKPDEFWPRMFKRWKEDGFENSDLADIIEQVTGENPTTITYSVTERTLETWRDAIESKWKIQGEIGTAVHAISEFYFGKTNDAYNFA